MKSDQKSAKVALCRQPEAAGHELLFRPDIADSNGSFNGNTAIRHTIYDFLLETGTDNLVADKFAYINIPYDFLVAHIADFLPPEKTALEIDENIEINIEINNELIKKLKDLAEKGFSIALNHFHYSQKWDEILKYIPVVKIDVDNKITTDIEEQYKILRKHNVLLLAAEINIEIEFKIYYQMGFDYFQGYFFMKPHVVKSKTLPDNHIAILQATSRLQNNSISVAEIESQAS